MKMPPLDLFKASQFTATEFATAEDKAKFANTLARFAYRGCPRSTFNKPFYRQLSMMFGHIAHYDRDGFYGTWFETATDRKVWLRHVADRANYGSPKFTWCDVEKAFQTWVRENWCGLNGRQDR